MIEQLKQASTLNQGFFVAAVGLVGVFLVLVLFFFAIKIIELIERK
jgi:Na+-transporting methylmalonyl-CoA/oxaloacetate decarboxylase gamma subunit